MNPHEQFGLLRELVQRPNLNTQLAQLRPLIEVAHLAYPEPYQAIWLPYLRDHLKSMRWAPCVCDDLEALSHEHQRQRWPWLALVLDAPRAQTLDALLEHPACAQITHLCLDNARLDDDAAQMLLSPQAFPALISLELTNNALTGKTLGRLIKAFGARLRWLDLSSNPITERHLIELASGSTLSSLQGLRLHNLELGANALRALVSTPRRWRSLDLSYNAIGDKGMSFIARTKALPQLTSLNLNTCHLSPKGLDLLLSAPYLHQLRELDISLNPLGARWATGLLGQGQPLALRALRFGDAYQLTDEAWSASHVEGAVVAHLRVLCARVSSQRSLARLMATEHMIRRWPSLEVIDLGRDASLMRPDLNPYIIPPDDAAPLELHSPALWSRFELDTTYCFAWSGIKTYERRAVDYFYHDELW